MRNYLLVGLLFVFVVTATACSNPKKRPVDHSAVPSIERYQKKLQSFYDDAKTSPLNRNERKGFEGINFFPIDTTYMVKAHFEKLDNQEEIQMPMTGGEESLYVKYAQIHFELNDENHQLFLYQSQDLIHEPGYENYLFLPFLDATNGSETYGGGRYLDLENPFADTIVVNFNLAYHPYCAYAERYSCPIVPFENLLETRVEAGVKF